MISSAEEFLNLRLSEEHIEYERAVWDTISDEVCLEIIQQYPDMKAWVVHNKTVSLKILHLLAEDEAVDIRFSIAMKRKCDFKLFEKLSIDKDFSVRLALVRNPKIPLEILKHLMNDKEGSIATEAQKKFKKVQARL